RRSSHDRGRATPTSCTLYVRRHRGGRGHHHIDDVSLASGRLAPRHLENPAALLRRHGADRRPGQLSRRRHGMKILGVDPGGASGALAKLEVSPSSVTLFDVTDVPLIGSGARQRVDVIALQEWLLEHKLDLAFVERSQAMPKQGASSGFKYGRTTGALEAVITVCGIPLEIVEPSSSEQKFRLRRGDTKG